MDEWLEPGSLSSLNSPDMWTDALLEALDWPC